VSPEPNPPSLKGEVLAGARKRASQSAIRNSLKPFPPILEVRDLSIRRDATRILEGVTWTVERGQHWVILGANGSGKTSLLSALTGYLSPTSGDVTVLGQTFGESDWRELRTHVGLVSSSVRQMMADHEPALTTVISGKYAMIDYWGRVKREDRAAASRILKQIEATHLAARPWLVLSQGERQRILIGRALMARPRLLILDEPCAGLDPVARENFLAFLQRLGSRRGAPALILVTHHVEEIAPVFGHALLLRGGSALASGEKDTVLTSANLSLAFGASVRLLRENGRYTLHTTPHSSKSIV
jgi:iron complex transport system ATP-binding protein